MIQASIFDKTIYETQIPGLIRAMQFLKNGEWKTLDTGRHEIDGDNLYALIQCYDTTPADEVKLEAHRRYLDVQFVAEGEEILEAVRTEGLVSSVAYNPEKDVEFFQNPPHLTALYLRAGDYAVLYPEDAHKPHCHAAGVAAAVKKIVVKVKL